MKMKTKKRGQISIEYLVILGFATLAITTIIGLAFYYVNTNNDQMISSHIQNFGNTIINNAESVYFAGPPSKITVNPYLPKGVTEVEFVQDDGNDDYYLMITYQLSSGVNTIGFRSNVPLVERTSATNGISLTDGIKNIEIEFGTGANSDKISIMGAG